MQINSNRTRLYSVLEIFFIIGMACVPLAADFPYRVNIFLSWEGAYRLSEGQIPYKDFGMPLGYMYWTVPAFFFKLFGPQMLSLIKAQVFLNIVSGLAFRSILVSLKINPGIRLLSVILYVLSFSFFNFWPWYNHTVIVYEMIALAFLFRYIYSNARWRIVWLVLSSLFVFFSFFTKQDGGLLAFLLCGSLLLYYSIVEKKIWVLPIFIGLCFAIGLVFILPLTQYSFGYWFNYGQDPHTARVSLFEIIEEFFYQSQWIKFYLLLILLILIPRFKFPRQLFKDRNYMLFLLLTLGILVEASIIQVTSYTPPDNNIFFHSFAFAFIIVNLSEKFKIDFQNWRVLLVGGAAVLLWWSSTYWKYMQRIIDRAKPAAEAEIKNGENVVNRKTYMINTDTLQVPMNEWVYTNLNSLKGIYLPGPTARGIERLMNMDLVKNRENLKVLNMTELTSLAVEIPYELEKSPQYPLWYHLGVSMFNKEAEMFEAKIRNKEYDLVLFEHIPTLNNFYPFRIRETLQTEYVKVDSFYAPRRGNTVGQIEVFVKQ